MRYTVQSQLWELQLCEVKSQQINKIKSEIVLYIKLQEIVYNCEL